MRKVKNLLLILALTIFTSQCFAPTGQSMKFTNDVKTNVAVGTATYNSPNGRGWNQLDRDGKVSFMEGLFAGITVVLQRSASRLDSASNENSNENLGWLMTAMKGHNREEVMQAIEAFYSDSANVNIPIIESYKYALFKFEGAKQDELDNALSKLREQYR